LKCLEKLESGETKDSKLGEIHQAIELISKKSAECEKMKTAEAKEKVESTEKKRTSKDWNYR